MSECAGGEAGWAVAMFVIGTAFGAALVHYRACPRLSSRFRFERKPFERPSEEDLYKRLSSQYAEDNENDGDYPDTGQHEYQAFNPYEDPQDIRSPRTLDENSYVDVVPDPVDTAERSRFSTSASSRSLPKRQASYIEVGPDKRHSSARAHDYDQAYVDSQYIEQTPDTLDGDGYMQVNYTDDTDDYGSRPGGVAYAINDLDDDDDDEDEDHDNAVMMI
eukprot:m.157840 g.157840  ORF g.157840 m.157840 type:complete len:219 (+) comp31067_c2_seq9:70-726(+)